MKTEPIISGAGVVSPIGNTFPDFSEAIYAGDSAVMEISSFDHSGYDAQLAAEALDFDLKDFLKTPKNYLDRNTALAFGAMCSAIQHSGLDLEALDKSRVALAWGTELGSADTMNLFYADIQTKGPRFGKPILFPHAYSNTTISLLSIEFKISGPHINFASGACASSQAIAFAAELVENSEADIAIAGGSEAFGETSLRYNLSRNILATDSRPDGIIMGEAAAAVIIENPNHARRRNAKILAQLSPSAFASKTKSSMHIEDAMEKCLDKAGVTPQDIDLVVSAQNNLQAHDLAEQVALDRIFGKNIPMFLPKKLFGETFGASGIMQIVSAMAILQKQKFPNAMPNIQTPIKNIIALSSSIEGDAAAIILTTE